MLPTSYVLSCQWLKKSLAQVVSSCLQLAVVGFAWVRVSATLASLSMSLRAVWSCVSLSLQRVVSLVPILGSKNEELHGSSAIFFHNLLSLSYGERAMR